MSDHARMPVHDGEVVRADKLAKTYAEGTLIGVIGTVLGVVGGVLLTLNLEHILKAIEGVFGVQLLPEDVYYITGLPTDMQVGDIVVIAAVALTMAFLATLYPAWRASRTAPAEALRYE